MINSSKIFSKMSSFIDKYLFSKNTAIIVFLLWFLFSFVWTFLYKHDVWYSDYGIYQYYASMCSEAHTMYPNETFVHNECILAPGWINILTLWHVIFKSFTGVPYLLLCMNALNAWLLWLTCSLLSQKKALKYIVFYCYILIPAFATNSIVLATEVPYVTFSLLSFYLCLRKEYISIVFAGISIAIALWIRPLADAWIIAALFILITNRYYIKALVYSIMVIITCSTISIATHANFPDYVYKATTGGVNLLMGANDNSIGTYVWGLRSKGGVGYLPGLRTESDMPVCITLDVTDKYHKECSQLYRYNEVDRYYKEMAIEWIVANPIKWIKLIPKKLNYLLFKGTFKADPLSDAQYLYTKPIRWMYNWQTAFVTIIMIISIIGLFFPTSWKDKHRIYVVIPIILATGMTIMCFGDPRFNFIFLPLVLIYFAYTIMDVNNFCINHLQN